jgi:hypothetical protein
MYVGPSVGPREGSEGLAVKCELLAVFVIWFWADNEGRATPTRFLDFVGRHLLPIGLVNDVYPGNAGARNSIRAERIFLSVGVDMQRDHALRVGVRDICCAGGSGFGVDHLLKGRHI